MATHPSKPAYFERAVVFGKEANLLGVVSEPDEVTSPKNFAVLILTPGMLHSAGPFRMHVELAKQLGNRGLRSLRFDMSGIGESLAAGATGCSLERVAGEIREAIDFLTAEYDIHQVALFGLCSGADDALHAALHDNRIVGVFALDGCGYRTRKFYQHRLVNYVLPKLLSVSKWKQRCASWIGNSRPTPTSLQLGNDIREFPDRAQAEQNILSLLERNVQLHFHYTGGVDFYYNYADQFTDMFPRLSDHSGWKTSYQPESDHVAFLCEHRHALIQLTTEALHAMSQRLS